VSDDWIREQAKQHRERDEAQRQEVDTAKHRRSERLTLIQQQSPALWADFARALRAKADAYNSDYGTQVIYVESISDFIRLRAERGGKALTFTFQCDAASGHILGRSREQGEHGLSESGADAPTLEIENGRVCFGWSGGGTVSAEDAASGVMRTFIRRL
jgi:hypothetical protein